MSSVKELGELLAKAMIEVESKPQLFVVMKFGDKELDSAFKGVIVPTVEKHGFNALRIDQVENGGLISAQIKEEIAKSKIVLCDLTGERPNCYYEAGYADASGKEIIYSIKHGEKIHFDLAGHRFIVWETESDFRRQLDRRLAALTQ